MTAGRRWLGFALMLPLAVVPAESVRFGMACAYERAQQRAGGIFWLVVAAVLASLSPRPFWPCGRRTAAAVRVRAR